MLVLTVFDHALAVALVVLFPLRAATFGFRRLLHTPSERLAETRRVIYREAIAIQWALAACVAALWLALHRAWSALGVIPHVTPGLIGVIAGSAIVVVMIARQHGRMLDDDEALDALRKRMRHIEVMLPHERAELPRFRALSLTAGVCEELLFRGYLIWYFVHWLGLLPAAALSSALFGVGHLYQGVRGMLITALFGAFLAAVYLVSGSLLMPIAIHAAMDIHSGSLMLRAWEREREQALESRAGETVAAPDPGTPDPREAGEPRLS